MGTTLVGVDASTLPATLRVRGELRGPEIDGVLRLEALPGEAFRIPRLRTGGSYTLEDIRLVDGGTLLSYATPRMATIEVAEILLTSVSSRPLTLEEIRSLGIVIGDDSFQMFRFVFGFGTSSEEIVFEIPVAAGVTADRRFALAGTSWRPPSSGRFRPPRLAPFQFAFPSAPELSIPLGGCSVGPLGECHIDFVEAPVVGVLAFPTDVALLHQFFSVLLRVQNGAPAGDVLVLRDLAARISLPPALRQAETVPPAPLGVPVPVRGPGPDGEVGTADDVSVLIAQAEGQVEILVEGLAEGSHVARFAIDGVLEGLPSGPRAVSGEALGAVVVRNPHLQVAINHPEVVRADEAYPLHLTVSNLAQAPVNLLSLTLPLSGLSGVTVIGSRSRSIATLAPGEAETVTFDLVAQRTGRVIASTVRTGSVISPLFEFSVGVSTDGIPLSPDSIVLPSLVSDQLPSSVHRPALSLIGLGHSLATARQADLGAELPRVDGGAVLRRVYRLVQAARHRQIGEDLFDSLAVLAAEWQGARDGDVEWDGLRRRSAKGASLAAGLGAVLEAEATASSGRSMADRLYGDLAFLPESLAVLVDDAALDLRVESVATGAGLGGAERDLPFAERYPLGAHGALALVTQLEPSGYRVVVESAAGGTGGLHLLLPAAVGSGLRAVRWPLVTLAAGDRAEVTFRASDTSFTLAIDRFGDGLVDESLPGAVETVPGRGFSVVAARQTVAADATGHVVDVLFTEDVDRAALGLRDASRFEITGYVSDGGALTAGRLQGPVGTPSENLRMVRVVFDNPLGPAVSDLFVRNVTSAAGGLVSPQTVPLQITTTTPGGPLEGTVFGTDGQAVAFAVVELFEWDRSAFTGDCIEHQTGAVRADAAGRFRFDFVRSDSCDASDRFRLAAADPSDVAHGDAVGRIRFPAEITELNIRMIGRGVVRGQVLYEDGSVPAGLDVRVWNPVFEQGRLAHVDADGRFDAGDVMVGTVEISANDDQGNFAFATLELATAGALAVRDLVIVRGAPAPTGQVRGTATDAAGLATIEGAILALYVDEIFAGTATSDAAGRFDFASVPVGTAEIEIFDPTTGASGGRVFFDLVADQVVDIAVPLRDTVGAIEGRVLRQRIDGTVVPEAGAIVWARGQPANTVSGTDGSYRLEGVIAGTSLQVLAADPETKERASAQVTLVGGGTAVRDLLIVEQAATTGVILGEVLGTDGLPVQGALVHIANRLQNPTRWSFEAVTDAAGRFTLRATAFDPQGNPVDLGLAPGTYALHAVAGSLGGTGQATIRFPGDTPFVSLRFVRGDVRLRTLAEQVDGTQIGVQSQVQWRPTVVEQGLVKLATVPSTLQTDASGDLFLPGMLAGGYEAFVSNPFHGEATVRGVLVSEGQLNEHDIVFTETTGAVRGRVLDYDGVMPVAGVSLALSASGISGFNVVTDAEGRYAFELVPIGAFTITAVRGGGIFRTRRISGQLDRGGQQLEDVDIVLPRQGTVVGLVQDADGLRVPGAVVTLYEHAYPNRSLTVTADGAGNFEFDNVMAGGFGVRAQAPSLGGLGGRSGGVITDEGEIVPVVITLEPTAEIEGRVLSPVTGAPVASARVSLYGAGLVEAIDSAEDGSFRFRLLPLSSYRVRAFDPTTGRFGESASVILAVNGEIAVADVTLQARGEVDGHVLEPGGVAIAGATVRLRANTPFFDLDTFSSADAAGYYLFGGIPEGTFEVSVREPGGRRTAAAMGSIAMEDERVTVDLVLQEFGSVTGSVLAPPGLPAGLFPGSNVRLLGPGGILLAASLDNPYLLEGLLPGESFTLRAEELGGGHRGVATGRISAQGGVIPRDVQMVAIGQVSVAVADSFGNPVAGVDVSLTSRGALGTAVFHGSTGADDRVSFDPVAAGTVSVVAHDPVRDLRGTASGELVLEGESVSLTVSLEPTGFVQGMALAADGVTPASGVIAALRQGSVFTFAEVAADGSFSFAGVRLGGWELTLQEELGLGSFQVLGTTTTNGELVDLGALVLDERDPEVTVITPLQGTHSVPVAQAIVVSFSEPMDAARYASGQVRVTRVETAGEHSMIAAWDAAGETLTLTPFQPFLSGTLYEVVVSRDLVDRAGRRLAQSVRSTFTTADVVAPAVIDILPRDQQNQVAVSSSVVITFSEPVDIASLSGAALELFDLTAGQGVTTTFQLRPNEREVVLTAAFGLVADRNVRVRVQGVKDLAGNVMTAPTETTFWTVDETPPTGSFQSPADGTSYTAGDLVPAAVTASDNRGVAEVRFHLGAGTFIDAEAPYALDIPAPRMSVAGDLVLDAEIVDLFGNVTVLSRTIHVEPRVNGVAPAVTAPCLEDGDRVLPARALPVPFTVSDDQGIESYAFLVDGALQNTVAFQHQATISDSFTWTPPATAVPGTTFVLRLEASDYAGNVGAYQVTVTTPADLLLLGDRTASAALIDGRDVVFGDGVITLSEAVAPSALTLLPGTTLVAGNGTVAVTASAEIRIQCGAAVDVTALGWAGGTTGSPDGQAPAGIAGSEPDAGGSHGGLGVVLDGAGPAGETFGSVYAPSEHGGGGALAWAGETGAARAGGGAVHLAAPAVIVAGNVLARGDGRNGPGQNGQGGAGAGGSIRIEAGTLRGAGLLDASGDDFTWCPAGPFRKEGPGGGGRIALDVTALDGFDPTTQALAFGGQAVNCFNVLEQIAGAGTVYLRTPAEPLGLLRVDGGVPRGTPSGSLAAEDGITPPATPLPRLAAGTITQASTSGTDLLVTPTNTLQPRWLGAWMVLEAADGTSLGTFRVLEIDGMGRARLEGAATVTGATAYRGVYRFDRVQTKNGASVVFDTPWLLGDHVATDDATLGGTVEAQSLRITAGTAWRVVEKRLLALEVTGTLTVEAGAALDADGAGFQGEQVPGGVGGDAPAGIVGAGNNAGASHGGRGQSLSIGASNIVYGSVYWPRDAGASAENALGDGGGALRVTATDVVLDGVITARGPGASDVAEGAGAGGSVRIDAATLSGTGLIDASGGDTELTTSNPVDTLVGAGGGGRVAIYADLGVGFDPATQIRADGGERRSAAGSGGFAAPGTVLLHDTAAVYGRLRVVQQTGIALAETPLPTLGAGIVGALTPDTSAPGAAWIASQAGSLFAHGSEGAWLRVSGIDYRILDLSADRTQALLDGADGAVAVGDAYAGVWKFDHVTVDGGATLVFADPSELGGTTVGNGTIVQPAGTWVSPLEGETFIAGETLHAEVDTGTNPVVKVTFTLEGGSFAGGSFVDTTAPWSADIVVPFVAAPIGGTLQAAIEDSFGNVLTLERAVSLLPRTNAVAPAITADCVIDGDRVLPGVAMSLALEATDDEAIESHALFVDGVLIERISFIGAASVSHVYTWTPPAGAVPGQAFALRLEARDYAGNVTAHAVTLRTPSDLLLTAGGSLTAATVAGRDVVLAGGSFEATEALAPLSLALLGNATLSAPNGSPLTVMATGEVRVQCGGAIDVTARGWAGGTTGSPDGQAPAGIAGSEPDAGGSHGGPGIVQNGAGPAGAVYGSVYAPIDLGAGGALTAATTTGDASAGGGAVHLVAGEVVLGGDVLARGDDDSILKGASGAGGSIRIEAGTLRGSGTVDASGGDHRWCTSGANSPDGAGGGGRIALDVTSLSGFDPLTQAIAHGGQMIDCFGTLFGTAGAGTVYLRTPAEPLGLLRVDGGVPRGTPTGGLLGADDGITPAPTPLPRLGAGTITQASASGTDLLVTPASALQPRWLGAWMVLEAADGTTLGTFRVLEIDGMGQARLEGAATVTGATAYRGVYRFDRVLTQNGASVVFDTPWLLGDHVTTGDATLGGTVEAQSLRITAGTAWRAAEKRLLELEVTGILTIEAGATLDADGAGFQGEQVPGGAGGDAPAGIAGTGNNAGASHGGLGQAASNGLPNAVYDSVFWPREGGASAENVLGDGGGALRVTAGEVVLEGAITARGAGRMASNVVEGAGAGGSVRIDAAILRGAGTIDASGGSWDSTTGSASFLMGAGGGGRVAVYATSLIGFDPAQQIIASGGERSSAAGSLGFAAPGTVFVHDSASIHGRLYVIQSDPGTFPLPDTPLPAVGQGTVGTLTPDTAQPADVWIDDAGGKLFGHGTDGVWLRLPAGDFRILAESADRTQLLLGGAAGLVAPGDAYVGLYKLDQLIVRQARVVFGDGLEAPVVDVVGGEVVEAVDVSAPVIGAVTPADGLSVLRNDVVAVTAAVTDDVGVASATLIFDGVATIDDAAPYAWSITAPMVDVATDFDLVITAVDPAGNAAQPVTRILHVTPGLPPTITSILPADGSTFQAGDLIVAQATATDDVSVTAVTFTLGGSSFVDTVAPFAWTVNAPQVTVPTDIAFVVDAVDPQLHHTVVTRTLHITPGVVAPPPVLGGAGCVRGGTLVLGGTVLPIDFTITAPTDDTVASWRVSVDGVEIASAFGLSGPVETASTSWTVPATAAAGDTFMVRLEATTAAGGAITDDRTIAVPLSHLVGPLTLDATFDGQDLVLGPGVFTAVSPLAPASVTLLSGASLTHPMGAALEVAAVGEVRVACGATIDATSFGYAGGTKSHWGLPGDAPSWARAAELGSGGGHGGEGIRGFWTTRPPGEVYGSVYVPALAGGGGASTGAGDGGDGGGLVTLEAAAVVLDGTIEARGETVLDGSRGSGAGGGVRVVAGQLSGSGVIDVRGGDYNTATTTWGGTGGGGRVSLMVDDLAMFDQASQVLLRGGRRTRSGILEEAAPGTLYVLESTDTWGHLYASAEADSPTIAATELPTLGSGSVTLAETEGNDLWLTGGTVFHPRWAGAWIELSDANGALLGTFNVLAADAAGRARIAGAAVQASTVVSFAGLYRFDSVRTLNGGHLDASDPLELGATTLAAGDHVLPATLRMQSLRLSTGARLMPARSPLRLDIAGTLTIEAGATIDASGGGYAGATSTSTGPTTPPWIVGTAANAGGSHGGVGTQGYQGGAPPEVYGSLYSPSLGGAGGRADHPTRWGGSGGGAVHISAQEIVLDGSVLARGQDRDSAVESVGVFAGAGAGGSVLLVADTVRGSGTIDVSGGSHQQRDLTIYGGGAGGGGRIAVWAAQTLAFDVAAQAVAHGGDWKRGDGLVIRIAAPGTILSAGPGDTWGKLIVDAGFAQAPPVALPVTELPSLGTVAVTAVEDVLEGLWLSTGSGFLPRWLGAEVELLDAQGSPLGTFRAAEIDATGRVLLAGATAAGPPATARGRYRFDGVTVGGGAQLMGADLGALGDLVFDRGVGALPGGSFTGRDLTVRAGSTLELQGDATIALSGTASIEAGATIDATGYGFVGGLKFWLGYPGEAPLWVTPSGVNAGGSHGGEGMWGGLVFNPGGEPYDSVYVPTLAGGGGGSSGSADGRAGGGVITIRATDVVLDGAIASRGADALVFYEGAGGGGSILIDATSLSGSGTIDARGGDFLNATSTCGGGGGGGRVSLLVDNMAGFDPSTQVSCRGGRRSRSGLLEEAAAGTIYTLDSTGTWGRLWVAGAVDSVAPLATALPPLGSGAVTLAEVDGTDLWITAASPFHARWVGAWVDLEGSGGGVLGTYSVLEVDASGRIRVAGAAAQAGTAVRYSGRYRFDSITTAFGATVTASDPLEVATP